MSSGKFEIAAYRANDGNSIYGGLCQPETTEMTVNATSGAITNNGSTATVNQEGRYKVSRGAREIGVRPRTVTFRFASDADVPDEYAAGQTYTLPVFVNTFWDSVALGVTGTYLGAPIVFLSKKDESIN